MDRRRFISIAGGAGLGILLPYAVYRSLSYGFGAGHVNVKGYEHLGRRRRCARLRRWTSFTSHRLTASLRWT